jgi:Tfp pilus assembly protein PilO
VFIRAYKKYLLTMALVWAACLVLFVLAYFFIIAPRLKVKAELAKESAQKRQLYESAIDAANEESKRKLADEVERVKNKLGDYITEFEESANLTFDIGRIAAEKQVGAFTVKTTDQAKNTDQLKTKSIQENLIQIAFESDFRQFATFLNTIERHRPVIFVDRFKVSRGGQNEATNTVDMDLSFFVRKRTEG